ncbi:MAG: tetratricopeptide repeat protein [Bacteroidota bacterium]
MKLRVIAILGGILIAASLSAQTLTDVINEFNAGVEKVNNQEYDASLEHFNQVRTLAESVGAEADEMKAKAEEQIPLAYYRQATLFMKRKQFDNAIPYLENTVQTANEFNNNQESSEKAGKYLMQSYMMEGQRNYKNESYAEALVYFDKALAMNENLYQAHLGKGMIFLEKGENEMMLEEFALAKKGALADNDTNTVQQIDGKIDSYYNKFIVDEMEMIDPEDPDYEYVIEACDKALVANPANPRALYHLALISNKKVEYDAAIEYALKALLSETEPVWMSAINFELGSAYENTVEYEKACETYGKVVEEPFLSRAEKKMGSVPGCN